MNRNISPRMTGTSRALISIAADNRMPERAQEVRPGVERAAHLVRQPNACPSGEVIRDGYTHPPRLGLCGFHEVLPLGAEDVKHQSGVQHRARQRTEDHPMGAVTIMGSARHPIPLWL